MRVARDPRFTRDFAALPAPIQERAEKKLALFLRNPRHPSLQTHKMEGHRNIWESRITDDYRFTFSSKTTSTSCGASAPTRFTKARSFLLP